PVRPRIFSRHGLLLRVDRDSYLDLHRVHLPGCNVITRVEQEFAQTVRPGQVVVVSDYGRGYCDPAVWWTPLMEAFQAGCPILVDPPRNGQWASWCTARTTFKANRRQAISFLKEYHTGDNYRLKYGRLETTGDHVDVFEAVRDF